RRRRRQDSREGRLDGRSPRGVLTTPEEIRGRGLAAYLVKPARGRQGRGGGLLHSVESGEQLTTLVGPVRAQQAGPVRRLDSPIAAEDFVNERDLGRTPLGSRLVVSGHGVVERAHGQARSAPVADGLLEAEDRSLDRRDLGPPGSDGPLV